MRENDVEKMLCGLLRNKGVPQARTAYHDLTIVFNAWKAKKTADNWADVEDQAHGARLRLPHDDDGSN